MQLFCNVRDIKTTNCNRCGSMLQFEKKLPKPKSEEKQDISPEDELGEMIFGI